MDTSDDSPLRAKQKDSWQKRLDAATCSTRDLDGVVLDYLLVEGFQDVAELLSEESKIDGNGRILAVATK